MKDILSARRRAQIVFISLGLTALVVIYLGFLLLAPFRQDDISIMVDSPARSGNVLQYHAKVCSYRQVPIGLTIRLIGWPSSLSSPNTILVSLPSLNNFRLGCNDYTNQGYLRLPTSWPTGNYKLQANITYKANRLRTQQQIVYSNTFKVEK